MFEAACHVRHRVAGHVLPVPNRPKEKVMSKLIEPKDIRVGDVVTRILRVDYVAKTAGQVFPDGEVFMKTVPVVSYELVSRPAPKPQVGQHWLDDKGAEHVVAGQSIPVFVSLATTQWSIRADVAPDGWTLES